MFNVYILEHLFAPSSFPDWSNEFLYSNMEAGAPKDHLSRCPDLADALKRYRAHLVRYT